MSKEAEIQQQFSQLADEFQKLQSRVTAASNLCPRDKTAALAEFTAVITALNLLLNKILTLRSSARAANIASLDSSLKVFAESTVTQAITDAAKAKQACEKSAPKVQNTPDVAPPSDGLEPVTVTGTKVNTASGLQGQKQALRQQATIQDTTNFEQLRDWRVRLALSPGADYLYKAAPGQRGILDPLSETNGVVFPYTPAITVSYAATYDYTTPTHSNYKILQYTNSAVENVTLNCDFTAQDTREANYLLAVIHFFRSVTKMWYGQDQFPKPGTPPPLVYLFGLGEFQFNAHPLVVTNFMYSLPNDVDYIRAGAVTQNPGVPRTPSKQTAPSSGSIKERLKTIVVKVKDNFLQNILPGGEAGPANFTPSGFSAVTPAGTAEPTYVPTKINFMITCMPVVSRNEISNNFSLKEYGSGNLLRGTKRKGGGFW